MTGYLQGYLQKTFQVSSQGPEMRPKASAEIFRRIPRIFFSKFSSGILLKFHQGTVPRSQKNLQKTSSEILLGSLSKIPSGILPRISLKLL